MIPQDTRKQDTLTIVDEIHLARFRRAYAATKLVGTDLRTANRLEFTRWLVIRGALNEGDGCPACGDFQTFCPADVIFALEAGETVVPWACSKCHAVNERGSE